MSDYNDINQACLRLEIVQLRSELANLREENKRLKTSLRAHAKCWYTIHNAIKKHEATK